MKIIRRRLMGSQYFIGISRVVGRRSIQSIIGMFHNKKVLTIQNKTIPIRKSYFVKTSNVSAPELTQAPWQGPHVAEKYSKSIFIKRIALLLFSFLSLTSQYKALITHVRDFLALTFGLNYSHSADVQCRIRAQ